MAMSQIQTRFAAGRARGGPGGHLAAVIVGLGALALAAGWQPIPAAAAQLPEAAATTLDALDPATRQAVEAYRAAIAAHERRLEAFWAQVGAKRDARRAKRRAGELIGPDDYALAFPPEYAGPALTPALARVLESLKAAEPPVPPRAVLTVQEAIDHARDIFGFAPETIPEREFKRRYAAEALTVGLTKDQVLRIYALETGGQGTFDMQAGINPITRQGKAISTALGYAQLLHANSVGELVKHGDGFVRRLEQMAAWRGASPDDRSRLRKKAEVVRRMLRAARAVPNTWADHIRYAGTPEGFAIHALNLDGDIGPWLQVIKLAGLRETAMKQGFANLSGAEIELMNLAGPMTGLEMLQPLAWDIPTVNFFSRRGYEVNSVVRKRTARELLIELDRRMELGLQKPGALEFAAAFDAVIAERGSR